MSPTPSIQAAEPIPLATVLAELLTRLGFTIESSPTSGATVLVRATIAGADAGKGVRA